MSQLLFLNIGGGELFFIVLVVIIFFGPKRIPELARGLGKGIKELKNATNDIQQEIRESAGDIPNIKKSINIEKQVNDLIFEETKSQPDVAVSSQTPDLPNTVSRGKVALEDNVKENSSEQQ